MTPVVSTGTAAFAPTVSNIAGGAALQIRPIVKPDLHFAVVDLQESFDELGSSTTVTSTAVAGGVFEAAPSTRPSTQPAGEVAYLLGQVSTTQPTAASAQSPFSTIKMKVNEFRTTIRLPLGKSTLVGSATWDPEPTADHPLQLLFILTVDASD
jgi:hypothetical protein